MQIVNVLPAQTVPNLLLQDCSKFLSDEIMEAVNLD